MASIPVKYAPIPPYAALLPDRSEAGPPSDDSAEAKRRFSFDTLSSSLGASRPSDAYGHHSRSPSGSQSSYNLASLLVSAAITLPPSQQETSPRGPTHSLLSTRDPLSLPITTTNFRRFVGKVGFVFWLMDRMEEIIMWRKGWKYTSSWVVLLSALCYEPRLLLAVPNIILISAMVMNYHAPPRQMAKPGDPEFISIADPSLSSSSLPPVIAPAPEGSASWLANIQAIQNLMGFVSDAYDVAIPHLSHLMWKSRVSTPLFLFLILSIIPIALLPIRLLAFTAVASIFTCTHPYVRYHLTDADGALRKTLIVPYLEAQLRHFVNEARLGESQIPLRGQFRVVEIYQNERWGLPSSSQTSSCNGSVIQAGWKNGVVSLKATERGPWTKGKDGSINIGESHSMVSLPLDSGWEFVHTEDWEPDYLASWSRQGADRDGWVYTNDAWLDPHDHAPEEWMKSGMTRRRRWIRRICPTVSNSRPE